MKQKPIYIHRLLAPAFFFLTVLSLCSSCSRQPSYPPAALNGSDIIIDTASLEPGTPKFYTYRFQGKNINYFVLKIQGEINAFLDACANCYPHKQGYRGDNSSVTCRACDIKIPINKLEKGIGSCYPIKIEGRTEKGEYRISRKTLEAAADKF